METISERMKYYYRVEDENGEWIPMVIAVIHIQEDDGSLDATMGMNCFPEIVVEDKRLPITEFPIPFYGQPLINLLDVMEFTLKRFPTATDTNEEREKLYIEIKELLLKHTDLDEKVIQNLKNGKCIRYLHIFRNDAGKFCCLFSIGYDNDPHLQMGFPCIHANIAEWDDGFKSILELRITNAWLFFCDLKHYDPRLGFDKDTIGLSFS